MLAIESNKLLVAGEGNDQVRHPNVTAISGWVDRNLDFYIESQPRDDHHETLKTSHRRGR